MLNQNKTAMCCPCVDCKNIKKYEKTMYLHAHLVTRGFMDNYSCWNKHGEEGINEGELHCRDHDIDAEYTRTADAVSDTFAVEFGEDYIEMAAHVEEIVRDGERDDYTDAEFAKFQMLLHDAKTPLYPGVEEKQGNFTKLFSVLKLLKLKATNCWSDKSFTELLELLCEMLPSGNQLPTNTYDAKRIICPLGLDVERIHACPNDSVLYRVKYADLQECPVCGTSRYKCRRDRGDDSEGGSKNRGAPRKARFDANLFSFGKDQQDSIKFRQGLVAAVAHM
ncbi:hypothetical protein ACP4OV_016143 [Aristida adscensionis]